MVKIAFLALKRPKIINPGVFITFKTVLDIIMTICDVIGVTILHLNPAGGHKVAKNPKFIGTFRTSGSACSK